MPASDPGLRRVSVHSGAVGADLTLPAELPIAVLVPSIVDILQLHGPEATRYHLSRPGASRLDPSMTLAQHDVADGAVLVLNPCVTPPPEIRHDDMAEAISVALGAAPPPDRRTARVIGVTAAGGLTGIGALAMLRNGFGADAGTTAGVTALIGFVALLLAAYVRRAYEDPVAGVALSLIATTFAVVAGFLAVPGTPGVANVLLAAMAAAVTAVLGVRASGATTMLTATSCAAIVTAMAALVGVITACPPEALGSTTTLVSLGLLGLAARISLVLTRLSPRLPSTAGADDAQPYGEAVAVKALHADNWLAALHATFSASAAAGAVVTVLAGAPRLCCSAFGALTGGLLLLRTRSGGRRPLVFVIAGIVVIATTFGVTALRTPEHRPWVAAVTAMLATAAMYLGFSGPGVSSSPLVHRGIELLESAALIAMVPLTCWICGVYDAIRGLNLT